MGFIIKINDKPKGCKDCPFYECMHHVHYVGYCRLNDKCIDYHELDLLQIGARLRKMISKLK